MGFVLLLLLCNPAFWLVESPSLVFKHCSKSHDLALFSDFLHCLTKYTRVWSLIKSKWNVNTHNSCKWGWLCAGSGWWLPLSYSIPSCTSCSCQNPSFYVWTGPVKIHHTLTKQLSSDFALCRHPGTACFMHWLNVHLPHKLACVRICHTRLPSVNGWALCLNSTIVRRILANNTVYRF